MQSAAKYTFVALVLALLAYAGLCLGLYAYGLRAWPRGSLDPPAPLEASLLARFAEMDRVAGPMPRFDPLTLPLRFRGMSDEQARWFRELDQATPRESRLGRSATRMHLALMAAAIHVSRTWSREQVLSARIGNAYFGRDARGLEAAAQAWYGQAAAQLRPHEVLALWVLAFSPSSFDPFCRPQRFDERYRLHAAQLPGLAGTTPDDARRRMRPAACH